MWREKRVANFTKERERERERERGVLPSRERVFGGVVVGFETKENE